jgi:hypothetical protein
MTAPPTPDEMRPVAWRYRWKLDGEWTSWRVSDHSQKSRRLKDLEEQPLYDAAALSAATARAEARGMERAAEIARSYGCDVCCDGVAAAINKAAAILAQTTVQENNNE